LLNQIAAIHGTGVAAATNSYESIATVTVGAGGSSSISFTSIVGTYKHLQLRGFARGTGAAASYAINMRFNSDSATNYNVHGLYGDGSSAAAFGVANATVVQIDRITGAGATANNFGSFVADILDYANTNKYKTARILGGFDNNGSGEIDFDSGAWRSTSAITSITLTLGTGNFAQYSSFALYGIKG
jgi:hypothetical protein